MTYRVTAPTTLHCDMTVDLPASKSLSNRALILQGLCPTPCVLSNVSDCDDTMVMRSAFDPDASHHCHADDGARIVDIGAAGTSMRFLTAYFATRQGAEILLTGSARMKQRPISLLVDALRQLGAQITYAETEGYPPLRIHGRRLQGGALTIDGSVSSQYISALLMVAPTLANGLDLTLTGRITSVPYIMMTLQMMRQFGVEMTWDRTCEVIHIAPQTYTAQSYIIESDWSAASYWYEISALGNVTTWRMKGLFSPSLQGDAAIATIFDKLLQRPERLTLDLASQPDLAQTVIVTCCALGIAFSISGLHTLRIKETDRVLALEQELRKLGYVVTDSTTDSTIVMQWDGTRCTADEHPVISTYKDHRMAMAFAPMALVMHGRSIDIDDPDVVSKSYPQYWQHLQQAGFAVEPAV